MLLGEYVLETTRCSGIAVKVVSQRGREGGYWLHNWGRERRGCSTTEEGGGRGAPQLKRELEGVLHN
jgi:hypothetical protein